MEYPYTLVKTDVKCISDDIMNLEQGPYDSMDTNYTNCCTVIPYMEFDDVGKRNVITNMMLLSILAQKQSLNA